MSRIPAKILVESSKDANLFQQIYPCYYNTESRVMALTRPTEDREEQTERERFLTHSFWNASVCVCLSLSVCVCVCVCVCSCA